MDEEREVGRGRDERLRSGLSSKRKGKGVIDGRSKQPTGKGNEF